MDPQRKPISAMVARYTSDVSTEFLCLVCVWKIWAEFPLAPLGWRSWCISIRRQCGPAHSGTSPFPSAGMEARYYWLTVTGLLLAARTQLLRWLSEWDDTLLLAGSPAAMQVRRKGKRDTVRYLGEPPPTVLPPLWGWRCWLQEPAMSKKCLTSTMVNLRMTGLCHSPGQSVQWPTVPAPHLMEDVVRIGLPLGEYVAYSTDRSWLRFPPNTDEGAVIMPLHYRSSNICNALFILKLNFTENFIQNEYYSNH